jgi:prepilin-type N-terminal cleavage/methylation domain-containing protein
MNKNILNKNIKGFTLVETMIAVFILSISIVSFMSVVSSSLFAAKYARDEITANYLLQEVTDYLRNDRDSSVLLGAGNTSTSWAALKTKYSLCALPNVCDFAVFPATLPTSCIDGVCRYLSYTPGATTSSFYNYDTPSGNTILKSKFQRKITVTPNSSNPDELDVVVTVTWKNGGLTKTRTLLTTLMKWQ